MLRRDDIDLREFFSSPETQGQYFLWPSFISL